MDKDNIKRMVAEQIAIKLLEYPLVLGENASKDLSYFEIPYRLLAEGDGLYNLIKAD